jgi:multicomponent Na+:H+ antiporter subunit G
MTLLGTLVLTLGVLILMLSSFGLFVFKDALSRQHAATKAGSLGIVVITCGAALIGGHWGWWLRAMIIILLVWMTMPIASHVLARAALREQTSGEPKADHPE